MGIKVAVNGFGRIGRLFCRRAILHEEIEIAAVNDIVSAEHLAYLFKYDTIHGRFQGNVEAKNGDLLINGRPIAVFSEKDPTRLPWKDLKIDYVIESTGHFTTLEGAGKHLAAGARRVIITAPGKDAIPLFVFGVNEHQYNPQKDFIVSNASCTTNCLAPVVKVLLDNFGIEEGLMTTIHSLTASQPTLDGPSKKDWRGGRAASLNIIPASTGAASAVSLCFPQLKGKLTGMAFRVPTADVSAVDLTVRLSTPTTYEAICRAMKEASEGPLKGILSFCNDPVVSSDFIGSPYSAIFDQGAGIALSPTFYKLIAWYDNEVGYAYRVLDLLIYMASKS